VETQKSDCNVKGKIELVMMVTGASIKGGLGNNKWGKGNAKSKRTDETKRLVRSEKHSPECICHLKRGVNPKTKKWQANWRGIGEEREMGHNNHEKGGNR